MGGNAGFTYADLGPHRDSPGGHRLRVEFDGGALPRVHLIHPGECDGDDADAETSWVEECGAELLNGAVELPVHISWPDGPEDGPCLTIPDDHLPI